MLSAHNWTDFRACHTPLFWSKNEVHFLSSMKKKKTRALQVVSLMSILAYLRRFLKDAFLTPGLGAVPPLYMRNYASKPFPHEGQLYHSTKLHKGRFSRIKNRGTEKHPLKMLPQENLSRFRWLLDKRKNVFLEKFTFEGPSMSGEVRCTHTWPSLTAKEHFFSMLAPLHS